METRYIKIHTAGTNAALKVTPGHFATNHSHINYYLDMTTLTTRTNEAQDIAKGLLGTYLYGMPVDTVVCMEGTEVIGAYLSEDLTSYIVRPEFNNNSQIIFRDNIVPMIRDKHVIILMATVTTGFSVEKAIESVQYYGGKLQGVSAIFSAVQFVKKDLPDYVDYDHRDCPLCKSGQKLDALVNAYGYSKL